MSGDNNNGNPLSRLTEKLGFNPASGRPDQGVYTSALDIVKKKRKEELQGRAVEVIEKAMDLAKKWDGVQKEFQKEEKKTMKELSKLLSSIEAMSNGQTVVDSKEETAE
jgi:hypothetical protein